MALKEYGFSYMDDGIHIKEQRKLCLQRIKHTTAR